MNQHDIANLTFLMKSDPQTLKNWYDSACVEDLEYAVELLDRYEVILENEIATVQIEHTLADMPVFLEAMAVISHIQDL